MSDCDRGYVCEEGTCVSNLANDAPLPSADAASTADAKQSAIPTTDAAQPADSGASSTTPDAADAMSDGGASFDDASTDAAPDV